MKVLMAILFIILMLGVTPAFAADSPINQQSVASKAIEEANVDINDVSQVTDPSNDDMVTSFDTSDLADENSGYLAGYDDGNYVGNYIVVDSSDLENTSYDEPDEFDDYVISSFGMPGEGSDYIDESDEPMVNSESIDQFDDTDEFDDMSIDSVDALDMPSEDVDYIDESDDNYTLDESDISSQSDETDNFDELSPDNQLSGDDYYIVTELDDEFGYGDSSDADQLNESSDDELNNDSSSFDPSDNELSEGEITSQIDTNCEPLIVTIVNGLRGVVQATLEGVCTVCMVLGNELETIL